MMWAIANNSTGATLSPQQVCDCATKQCCQGGWPEWAFYYVLFNGGITYNVSYPYSAVDSATCLLDTTMTTAAQITGWELVPAFNAMALMKAVSMQPVVAFISASAADFTAYASRDTVNIYNGACSTEVNHAVVVVGFNYTGPDLKGSYWIIKNSWYPTWGDKGFMYLAMTPDVRGKCGILSTPAMYPVYFPSGQQPARFASDKRGKWKITKVDDLSSSLFFTTLSISTITNGTFINNIIATALGATCAGMINPCGGGSCYISGGVPRCNCGAMSNMVETTINCTGWYRVMQGDTCPSIWNAANLTMSMFQAINPGVQVSHQPRRSALSPLPARVPPGSLLAPLSTLPLQPSAPLSALRFPLFHLHRQPPYLFLPCHFPSPQCQAPYLVVGQQVCIDSPLLTTMQRNPNANYSIYTVRANDTLSTISTQYLTRCTPLSVSPAAIAAQNFIADPSAPLPVGTNLIIPCIGGVGMIDGGCATSLTVCGSDFVSYPSYCHAAVNYGLSIYQNGPCDKCGAACPGRMGLAPASGFGCTQAICPSLWGAACGPAASACVAAYLAVGICVHGVLLEGMGYCWRAWGTAGGHGVLLEGMGYCWRAWGTAGGHGVLLEGMGYCWRAWGTAGGHGVLLEGMGYCWRAWGTAGGHGVLLEGMGYCWRAWGTAGGHGVLLEGMGCCWRVWVAGEHGLLRCMG
ncbi:unnamed protein product [Closterium sp. Naga37s-1]|nr:unnamed protein product [Closterium sp. Naga37s-1]